MTAPNSSRASAAPGPSPRPQPRPDHSSLRCLVKSALSMGELSVRIRGGDSAPRPVGPVGDRGLTGLASARCVKLDMASETDTEVVRDRPRTPEMEKRLLERVWWCVCAPVDAVAVSTVVPKMGSDGGAGA